MLNPAPRRHDRSVIGVNPASDTAPARLATLTSLLFFVACAVGRGIVHLTGQSNERWFWLDALVLVSAAATTIIGQMRRLPVQNVVAAAAICCVAGGAILAVGEITGIPFGAFTYVEHGAVLAWLLPLVWVVIVLNGRGVSRLVFRPWRKTRTYGFKVIGLTSVLGAVLALGLQPYASRVNNYWLWHASQSRWTWFGTPWICFVSWLLTTLLILAFATPFLINKKPSKSPPFYHPLTVWVTINGVFACGLAAARLKLAVLVLLGVTALLASAALAGARWSSRSKKTS